MATLGSIFVTLLGGSCVTVMSLVCFGVAVRSRHPSIAPRCTARPKDTIYNPHPQHSCQDRGSPMLGWINWTLGLTYDTMLRGIPGTGTREGGMRGALLCVRLDGIVLLRFHTVAMKVAGLATVLLLGIVLPAYTSGQCHRFSEVNAEDGTDIVQGCATVYQNITNYERTTIANVPSLPDVIDGKDSLFVTQNGTLGRLYAVTIVMWIVTAYFLYCLKDEWIQILAMRRVYYLESDIWEERCAELRETLLHDEIQKRERKKKTHFTFEETNKLKTSAEEKHLTDRDPWIPHPEQRDTVPNIALYSVLVGGLPSLPEQAIDPMNGGDVITLTKRDSIDWQLSLTAAFFDHCVPNQPGFSSSVAAVSIMPSSQAIAVAWRKWYKAARKLRRLRFIRDQINQRRHYDIIVDSPDGEVGRYSNRNLSLSANRQTSTMGFMVSPWFTNNEDFESPPAIYKSQDKNKDYYRAVLGACPGEDTDQQVYDAFHFGPEQTAVYSREFAQSSAACCPYGCFEGSVRRAKIDELIQMEREATEIVHEANLELIRARRMAVRWEENEDDDDDADDEGQGGAEEVENLLDLEQPTAIHEDGDDKIDGSQRSFASVTATPALKSPPTSPPGADRKAAKPRRKLTFDKIAYPEDMSLEFDLFQKASSDLNRSRANSSSGEMKTKGNSDSPRGNPSEPGTAEKQLQRRRTPSLEAKQRSGNLGLEADLYRKAQSDISATAVKVKKKPSHKRVRSLESMQFVGDLSLEADILQRANKSYQDLSKTPSRGLFDRDTSHSSINDKVREAGTPGTTKKDSKHRPTPTLEPMALPDDLGLESNLFSGISQSKLNHNGSDLSNVNSFPMDSSNPLSEMETPKVGNLERDPHSENNCEVLPTVNTGESEIDLEAGGGSNDSGSGETQWSLVQRIVANVEHTERSKNNGKKKKGVASGAWRIPSLRTMMSKTRKTATTGATKVVKTVTETAFDALDIQRESSYAVVTFTSRQAAVAARHCLADGRGTDRWITNPELPIPPLADAASGDILACRNCCKPVTLSIDDRQKDYRKVCTLGLLASIYIFYTIPLTAASRLVDPESLDEVFPEMVNWIEANWNNGAELLSGLLQSGIWTLFFALCPVLFRAIANFGSGATSAADAEYKALIYFWYFMTIAAFSTTLISNMFLNGLNNGRLGNEFREVIREIARTVPSIQAVTWLNWIIFRFSVLLPVNYLLNLNAFLFEALNFKCCARIVIGGGPGAVTPYRIYVDSGIVLLCLMALAPASPLVAPACFAYFLVIQPILRRNLIFMYRPKFDGGGFRWPVIFDICISCIVAGQILLTTQMVLKQAVGPAIAASIPILPTIIFHRAMIKKYLRAFEDAALLQTSMLDGWDSVGESSMEQREEFRRFLVDAHKAAYIPVCIASGDEEETLTAEPAVVVPLETDVQKDLANEPLHSPYQIEEVVITEAQVPEVQVNQKGATLRRAVKTLAAIRRRTESESSGIFASMINLNIQPEPSPFDRRASMSTKSLSSGGRRAAFRLMHDENHGKDE